MPYLKIFLSESGLLRPVKSKYPDNLSSNEESSESKHSLDICLLKSFIEKRAAKLTEDACFFLLWFNNIFVQLF